MAAETLLAALGLVVCLALLARMAVGRRRRERLDAWARQATQALRARLRALGQRHRQQQARRVQGQAAREADALIDRARRARPAADREGNVYRPHSFGAGRNSPPDGRHRKDH